MTSKAKSKGTTEAKQKRHYVRLEVFSPVSFSSIVIEENKCARRHPARKAGILLNLSGGGVLISTTDNVQTGEFVLLRFDIKGFEALTSVLGKVKRVEECEDGERLVGLEFLTPDQIEDRTIAESLSRLSDNPLGFSDSLRRLVSRYVFQRQVELESGSR